MIVITAPTGNIGKVALERVVDSGQHVRVIARDPSKLPAKTRARVEVVTGSHSDAAVVDRAFQGAKSVFWLVPPDFRTQNVMASYVDFSRPAADAVKRHGVERVVIVAALGRGTPFEKKAGLVTAALAMVDLFADSGASVRELALPSFMDNMLRQVEPIRSAGMYALPLDGNQKVPTCSTGDIGEVAAKLLLDPSWKEPGLVSVPVLGPEDLSWNEMASIMGEVLGKPVRYQQMPLEAHRANLVKHGASEAMAQGIIEMTEAKMNGLDNAVQRTAAASSPTSFRQWCSEVLQPAVNG